MAKIDIVRDPDAVQPIERGDTKLALGLDLGTTTGYAYKLFKPGTTIQWDDVAMGQWDLSAGPYDSGAIRFVRLRQFLSIIKPDLVTFEDVRYTPAIAGMNKFSIGAIIARAANSAELFGAFKATLCTWCEEHKVPCQGVGIGQIKKYATDKGNASKTDMILACNQKFKSNFGIDDYDSTGADNIADAAFVLVIGLESYSKGV